MSKDNALGAYLRARRELVGPQDVGLPDSARRRVAGLRREEVALLAGISSDYYLRLEQGRDQHPSPQVLDALARVLLLDEDATAYLHALAGPRRRRRARRSPERVPPGVRQLVMSRADMPAFVQGRYMDVLVANPLASALSAAYAPGTNLLRALFLSPEIRELYTDWDATSAGVVASIRALVGPDTDDPYLNELVGELSVRSEEFRRLWARHDVRTRTSGLATLHHPQVGPLELNYEKLAITGTDGQQLVVYHAAPGSPAAEALTLLAHLTEDPAGHRSAQPAPGTGSPGAVKCGPGPGAHLDPPGTCTVDSMAENRLGEYLRARRELIRPEAVGLPTDGRRRVPGLRREEVAHLAGISQDYYLRLEQGRDRNPSAQVLDAIARILLLDPDATAHLHRLVAPSAPPPPPSRRAAAGVTRMINAWSDVPASVQSRHMDVLAANPLGTALVPVYTPGTNLLRATFLNAGQRARYRNWDVLAAHAVAGLRALADLGGEDPYLDSLVEELAFGSEDFRLLWARHDVSPQPHGLVRLDHPEVGPLDLRYDRLAIPGTDGQVLVVHQAAPGTPSAEALRHLARLTLAPRRDQPRVSPGNRAR